MANFFPCPNPACTYQFDADQLPAAAMVTCPICRTRFPYRAASPEPALSTEVAAAHSEPRSSERVNRLIHARHVPKSTRAQTAILLVGFTLVVVAVLGGIMYTLSKKTLQDDPGKPFTDKMFNYVWKVPGDPWSKDDTLKRELGFNAFVYSKLKEDSKPEASIGLRCVMLGGEDGARGPRAGELEAERATVLNKFENVQTKPIQSTIAKQSVNGYQFDASLDNAPVLGEIYWFDNKGIGYVMAIWALKDKWELDQKDLAALRDTFEFAAYRNNWAAKADSVVRHSVENADYEVEDQVGIWERAVATGPPKSYVRDPSDEDQKATMLFRCKYPDKKRRKDILPEADAMVVVFDNGGDSPQDVVNYLQKQQRYADFKFAPSDKQPSGAPIPKSTASIGTFRATNSVDGSFSRYFAISVLKIGSHNVSVVGWCKEGDAEFMDSYILGLVASLKAK
jgi:hypothetical protein